MVLLAIFATIFITALIAWFVQFYKYERHLTRFTGPRPLPLIGNAHQFGPDLLDSILKFQKQYGLVLKTSVLFVPPVLFVSDVKFVEFILKSPTILDKADNYKYFSFWLGDGLLKSSGAHWRKQRKILTPAFHFKILEEFVDLMHASSKVLIKKLERYVGLDSVDVEHDILLLTLDILCASAMGKNINAQTQDTGYARDLMELSRLVTERMSIPLKSIDTLYYLSADYRLGQKLLPKVRSYAENLISSRAKMLEDVTDASVKDEIGIRQKLSFLDLMVRHKAVNNDITDESIREEMDTFLFAGIDTTASTLSFALYSLATHPEVQEEVVRELHKIFGNDRDRTPTYRDLQDMRYLDMVIKEVLRLYPSVPLFGRKIMEDVEYGGGVLPKDITIYIFNMGIHKNPAYFPDPERFDPERFTLENQNKRHPFAYIPFSAGQRNCIGQKFALLEIKIVLSLILRHYELLPSIPLKPPVLIVRITLKSKNGINLRFKKRQY